MIPPRYRWLARLANEIAEMEAPPPPFSCTAGVDAFGLEAMYRILTTTLSCRFMKSVVRTANIAIADRTVKYRCWSARVARAAFLQPCCLFCFPPCLVTPKLFINVLILSDSCQAWVGNNDLHGFGVRWGLGRNNEKSRIGNADDNQLIIRF